MRKNNLKVYKLGVGITISLLMLSSVYSYKMSSDLGIKDLEIKTITEQKTVATKGKEVWKNNEKALDYIKGNYPEKDLEESLLSFLDHLVDSGKFTDIELLGLEVKMENRIDTENLSTVEISVKSRGGTGRLNRFMELSRTNDFIDVISVKSVFNSAKGYNDNLITYKITANKQSSSSTINPKEIVPTDTEYSNITGNWVDFEEYKKELKHLIDTGKVQGQTNTGTEETDETEEKDDGIKLEIGGFESGDASQEQTKPNNSNSSSNSSSSNSEGFQMEQGYTDIPTTPTPKPTESKPIPTPKPETKPKEPKPSIVKKEEFLSPISKLDIMKAFSIEHQGLLLKSQKNESVKSIASGKVIFIGELDGLGNSVIIEHKNKELSIYSKLKDIAVKEDKEIQRHTIIGKTIGEELYLSFSKDDFEDPLKYIKENN